MITDGEYRFVLVENQLDFLTNKYPNVSPELIQQAMELDRSKAEKLVYGLSTGAIDSINPEALEAVQDLNPYQKKAKTDEQLAYEALIKRSKGISNRYWQWVLPILKAQPEAVFDESIFHYLEAEDLDAADIKDKSLEEVNQKSQEWHEQQFARQREGGTYEVTLETGPIIFRDNKFVWLPVTGKDARVEGQKMQNCIGTHVIPSDATVIFSMRNKFNNPHVSLSISAGSSGYYSTSNTGHPTIREIKGKNNRQPIVKYIPSVVKFVNHLLSTFERGGKSLLISYNSDFWNLGLQYENYVSKCDGDLPSQVLATLTDAGLNKYILHRGLNQVDKAIIDRLTPETCIVLLQDQSKVNHYIKPAFYKHIIFNRVVDDQTIRDLLQSGQLGGSASIIAQAVFDPQQFLDTLKRRVTLPNNKVDSSVLWDTFERQYADGLEAFKGTDPIFYELLKDFGESKPFNTRGYGKSIEEFVKCLSGKLTYREAIKTIQLNASGAGNNDGVNATIVDYSLIKLADVLVKDHTAKVRVIQLLPSTYKIPVTLKQSLLYSSTYEELKELYDLGNADLNRAIKLFLISVHEITLTGLEKSEFFPKVQGSAQKLIDDTELVLKTDGEEQLRAIYRTTKSRGVKIMVMRKLARLARLAAAQAGEAANV